MRNLLAGACAGLFSVAVAAGDVAPLAAPPPVLPVAAFAKFRDFDDVQISPNGDYISALVRSDNQTSLAILRTSDLKLNGALRYVNGQSVGEYWWDGPNRVIGTIADPVGSLGQPLYYGEMMGINADNTALRFVVTFREQAQVGTNLNLRKSTRGWATMVDPLPQDPTHAVIQIDTWNGGMSKHEAISAVYRIDTLSGDQTKLANAPFAGDSTFLTDHAGRVRYVVGHDEANQAQVWMRKDDDAPWQRLNSVGFVHFDIVPIGFSADDQKAYVEMAGSGGRSCLVEHDLAADQRRELACDEAADLDSVILSFDGKRRPIAAVFAAGIPQIKYVDPAEPDAKLLAAIVRSFPGQSVVPVSQTLDGSKIILAVYSDRNPGDYFLFDTQAKKARYLLSRNTWIDPATQAEVRAIDLKARDGLPLYGYLTLPRGRKPAGLPLVMMPHGGPIAIRDEWGWDPKAQMLANRGYAVLQVNFRGSGGYGGNFEDAGARAYGTKMIDDITDAVKWTIAQGFADPERVCIYGASYGGFAALMSAVREPDLYRCAVGYSGIYDLKTWVNDTAYTARNAAVVAMQRNIGTDPQQLFDQSPVAHLDKLKAAVLIIHGKDDRIVPIAQAEELRDALDQRKYPYELLVKSLEQHGFYKQANREEAYEKILAFLDKYIGSGATAPATPAPVVAAPANP